MKSNASHIGKNHGIPRSKRTEAQIVSTPKQMETGRKAEDVGREGPRLQAQRLRLESKYSGMEVSEVHDKRADGGASPY